MPAEQTMLAGPTEPRTQSRNLFKKGSVCPHTHLHMLPGRGKPLADPATDWQVTKNVCHTLCVGFFMLSFVIIQNYKYNNASMFIYVLL
jgi:diadenosine tetraphosphate (Ap4A) HIT family hydrolase